VVLPPALFAGYCTSWLAAPAEAGRKERVHRFF
jgi:hypothetical protein